ncbi:Cyclin-C [Strongyloides ratti]|uniref:Cyclin-C n=1 Tax=Strongyloides ratti TaxID=34506 RepID=A0A090KTU9_STRRB|nr:Cyclin-C [Strongyloides ratti]CEF60836.1 Cyclin-C [Strongyloides ratti]
MAFSFWSSSHYKTCLIDPVNGYSTHRQEDIKIIGEQDYEKLMIFFTNFIQELATTVTTGKEKISMSVIATAIVYFRRFYAKRSVKEIDPFLLAPTALLLACKADEYGYLLTDRVVMRCNLMLRKYPFLSEDIVINLNLIQEAEFYLIEIMDCSLIVFHPYRSLNSIIQDAKEYFESEDRSDPFKNTNGWDELISSTTKYINDSYRCDVSLKYPPHKIALACMLMALIGMGKESIFEDYYDSMLTDSEGIYDASNEIFAMYTLWKDFNEATELPEIFKKVPRPE